MQHGVAQYPLYWPLQYARVAARRKALFKVDYASARASVLREMEILHAQNVLISSNVPIRKDGLPVISDKEPDDPGVALYFSRLVGGREKPFALACDQFTKVRWNLRAIQATLEALRTIERNGTTSMMEQAFSGFAQLPPKSDPPWREVFDLPNDLNDPGVVKDRYLKLVRENHTGAGGGDHAKMVEINGAYERAKQELRFT